MTNTTETTTQKDIQLIVVDLDGTLLNSQSVMSERNERALKAAMAQGVKVVIATGKTRYSANDVVDRLELATPGIYLQGLTIYNADQSIPYQKTLDPTLARRVITFAEDRGYDMVAYSGSRLLVRTLHPKAEELATKYGEPVPEAIGPLQNILDEMPVNKLIAVKAGEPRKITALRWQLSKQLDGQGKLMQAMIPDMLEIIPPKTSKGVALQVLLKQMGIEAANVMAIGDGENDVELLEIAGLAVAVGGAFQGLQDIADDIVGTNDEDAVAQALEKYVLAKPLDPEPVKPDDTADTAEADDASPESEA